MLELHNTTFRKQSTINIKGQLFELNRPKIMGIINCTPDSFYKDSRQLKIKDIIKTAEQMLIDGADILDIGGASTRPGSKLPSIKEEEQRVLSAVKELRKEFPKAIISIDTSRSEIASKCAEHGIDIINDVSAYNHDPKIIDVAVKHKLPYILTYNRNKAIDNVKNISMDAIRFFSQKTKELKEKGLNDIILDPGFGFGKTLEQNHELAKHLDSLLSLENPILIGVSRKSMIYKKLKISAEQSLTGSTVIQTYLCFKGATIIRVHDVKDAQQMINLLYE